MTTTVLRTVLLMALLACASVGCDDASSSGSPTAPTAPSIPQVAGTYTGPLTISSSIVTERLTGSMRVVVVQAGSQITITDGSMTALGETYELPALTGRINATGFLTVTGGGVSGNFSDPNCGAVRGISSTWTFSGRSLRFHEEATTASCGTIAINATLTR